jgi:hypothetical protein
VCISFPSGLRSEQNFSPKCALAGHDFFWKIVFFKVVKRTGHLYTHPGDPNKVRGGCQCFGITTVLWGGDDKDVVHLFECNLQLVVSFAHPQNSIQTTLCLLLPPFWDS